MLACNWSMIPEVARAATYDSRIRTKSEHVQTAEKRQAYNNKVCGHQMPQGLPLPCARTLHVHAITQGGLTLDCYASAWLQISVLQQVRTVTQWQARVVIQHPAVGYHTGICDEGEVASSACSMWYRPEPLSA
jgi:hypothetical protein